MTTATVFNNSAKNSTRTVYPLYAANKSANPSLLDRYPDREVREDKGFYLPDRLSDADYDANPKAYAAFEQHAKHLHKAEGLLDDAWNLARLMLAALGDEGDDRAMQTESGLKVIEKKLSKAHNRIDRLHTQYTNLFLAYFDLKQKSDEAEPG